MQFHGMIADDAQAFAEKWQAEGACTVQLRDGLIYANHVFFDRTELLTALSGSAG